MMAFCILKRGAVMKSVIVFIVSGCLLLATTEVGAIAPGQMDDFQIPGNSLGWEGGHERFSPPPAQVPTGGPAGPGDGYLRISTSGFHLGTRNEQQWKGDYLAARVEAIQLYAKDIDPDSDEIRLRILLFGPGGTFASINRTDPIPGDSWQSYVFGVTAADLTHVEGGTGTLEDTLANVEKLLIRHDRQTPTLPGSHPPHIEATLGLDNITVITTPFVEVQVNIRPKTLNLASRGKWVYAHIQLPDSYNVADVDPFTIVLEGEIQPDWLWFNERHKIIMMKFSRSELQDLLQPGRVELTISGEFNDGTEFGGTDTIRVIDKGRRKKSNSRAVKLRRKR
jgi:hypothetical protein